MSETGFTTPAFNTLDISPNASESDVPAPQSAIMSLAAKLDYINPAIYDDTQMESESRQATIRHAWLEEAEKLYNNGDFLTAITYLKWVRQNVEPSGDLTHLDDIDTVIEDCYGRMAMRGKKAVSLSVAKAS